MRDALPGSHDGARGPATSDRLESWKEIAAYLKRDVTTVQRWEKREGLPVHRKFHDKLGSVYAFKPELDSWWNGGQHRIEAAEPPATSLTEETRSAQSVPRGIHRVWVPARRLVPHALLAGAAFAAGGLAVWSVQSAAPPEVAHLQVALDPKAPLEFVVATPALAISPDGRRLAYVVRHDETTRLHVRRIGGGTGTALGGTDGGHSPFFSPDGQWIGFVGADFKLKKIPAGGGPPSNIADVAAFRGASWGDDGSIVFAPYSAGGLFRVSATGGRPEALTTANRTALEKTHRYPEVLPGSKAAIFTSYTSDITSIDDATLELVSLETGQRRVLLRGAAQAKYVASGHLVFGRSGSLVAVPFDLRRLAITGSPVPVVDGVTMSFTGSTEFAVSERGTLAYISGGPSPHTRLVWVDRLGRTVPVMAERRPYNDPRFSPDGTRLLVHVDGPNQHIWIYDIARGAFSRLTFAWDYPDSVWTPDGTRVTFSSGVPGVGIGWQLASGDGAPEPLVADVGGRVSAWSPNGKVLLFWRSYAHNDPDIYVWRLGAQPQPLFREPFRQGQAVFSPDGRFVAYTSDESGRGEVYVRPFEGRGVKLQVSVDGGDAPRWVDGEILYRSGDRVMAARVDASQTLTVAKPSVLFEAPRPHAFLNDNWNGDWDVSSDGQRFVMVEVPSDATPPANLNVVINWFEELKRRVATISSTR
jgi:serine/threonine-protein kinase